MGIVLSRTVEIPEEEISAEYSRSSGPGGQHVNKTETKVVLRFGIVDSPSIPARDKARMLDKLGTRVTRAGEILVACGKHRDRSENERIAWERLRALLESAFEIPKPRKKTKPSRGAKERRLENKRLTSGRKKSRQKPRSDD